MSCSRPEVILFMLLENILTGLEETMCLLFVHGLETGHFDGLKLSNVFFSFSTGVYVK